MIRTLTKTTYRDLILGGALLCAAVALLLYPTQSMQAGRQGLELCANVIIPSLFPFFVLSSLVVELGLAQYLGRMMERLMYPLFRVGGAGASALALGFIGGYPVGARTAINLYQSGQCSKTETERLLAFCNNSGPAFILGVVGTGVFASGRIGLMLYLTHMAASLCVGLLFRFYGGHDTNTNHHSAARFQTARFTTAFTSGVKNAMLSILNICAFVLFFTVAIRMLFACGIMGAIARLTATLLRPLGVDLHMAEQLLTGILEMSSGVAGLAGSGDAAGRVSMAAFILGWAGLSVHCQVLSFIADSGLSAKTYLVGKVLHGVLSALFATALTRLFPMSMPVSGYLAQQVDRLAQLDFGHALTISATAAWMLWLGFFLLSVLAIQRSKKKSRNCRRHAL